jgi:peptide/nickel transport system substrate-binding protein
MASLTVVALTLMTACAPASKDDEGGEGSGSQRLVIARGGDIDKLDPHTATAQQTVQTLELVYDSLTEVDENLAVIPGLASEWEYDETGTQLTLTLRDGVTFHDGSTFDSADAKASLERVLAEETGGVARSNVASISDIETPDPLTLTLNLSEPNGTLPAAFADVNVAMLSEEDIEADTITQEPNGTGPFTFGKWTQGQSVSLDANEDYWNGAPKVAGIDMRVLGDQNSILAGMRADQFDMGVVADPAVADQAAEPLKLEKISALSYWPFMMNVAYRPLQDEKVRQAISCAIDRDEVIDAAVFGQGVETGPFTLPAFERDAFDGLPCADGPDPDLSRQLLEEAGVDNLTLETIVLTGDDPTPVNIAQSLKGQLAEIGVELQLQNLETNVYVERWLKGDFQTSISPNQNKINPHLTYSRYFGENAALAAAMNYTNPEVEQLILDGKEATDDASSQAIAEEISRGLVKGAPMAWLFTPYLFWVLQPDVEGFVPMPNGSLRSLKQVTIS